MLKQVMGTYIPARFSIHLNIEPQNLNIKDATFVHEYIHFMQDLLLPYCIRQNLVFINEFAWLSREAENSGKIIRPFTKWCEECRLTQKQTEYTWGRGQTKSVSGKIVNIEPDFFVSLYGHRIFKYNLEFEDGGTYQFGARDLLEYLAHKIENRFWKTNAPDLPYRTVDKIFDYYSLSFIPESVRLLIVEYCLYNDNPAHFLLNMFIGQEIIKKNEKKFCEYEECFQFLLGMGWQSNGGFDENIFSKTERRLNDFRQQLSSLYPHRQFDSIKEWILSTSDFCKAELSNRFIISSLYNMSRSELDDFMGRMIDEIGIPVIFFSDDTIMSSLLPEKYDSNQFVEFYVLGRFMEWISTSEEKCPLHDICQKNYKVCQEICRTNPFVYAGECKFKLFLKSYCLDKIRFFV